MKKSKENSNLKFSSRAHGEIDFYKHQENEILTSQSKTYEDKPDIVSENLILSETIFDGQCEQGVEFDYTLPDYFPDIFKIVRTILTPGVISYSISGGKLIYDGVVYIKVIYLPISEDEKSYSGVKCIEHRYTYSKSIDLPGSAANISQDFENEALVSIRQKTDYVNCRAVTGRRIDVRGAVSGKIKITSSRMSEVITEAVGCGLETCKTSLSYCGEKINRCSQFVVRESIETGSSTAGNTSIIHTSGSISLSDIKLLGEKAVVRGDVNIKALYITDSPYGSDDSPVTEVMEATIPVSQVIDVAGITDKHLCYASLSILDMDLSPGQSENSEHGRIFEAVITIDVNFSAHLEKMLSPVTDVYSTDFDTDFETFTVNAETLPVIVNEKLILKSSLPSEEAGQICTEIIDADCEITNVVSRIVRNDEDEESENITIMISGQASYCLTGRTDDGKMMFINKSSAFELPVSLSSQNCPVQVGANNLQVSSVSYVISGSSVDLRVSLSYCAAVYGSVPVTAIKSINVNREKPKAKEAEYALKLYFADAGESIWDIARRYNTSCQRIIGENEFDCEPGEKAELIIKKPQMILIPV